LSQQHSRDKHVQRLPDPDPRREPHVPKSVKTVPDTDAVSVGPIRRVRLVPELIQTSSSEVDLVVDGKSKKNNVLFAEDGVDMTLSMNSTVN
jgi:hypothetical protein